jgi:hypothetical protein
MRFKFWRRAWAFAVFKKMIQNKTNAVVSVAFAEAFINDDL